MATDRSTENRIIATINENRRRATRRVYRIGIPVLIIASGFIPAGIPAWVVVGKLSGVVFAAIL